MTKKHEHEEKKGGAVKHGEKPAVPAAAPSPAAPATAAPVAPAAGAAAATGAKPAPPPKKELPKPVFNPAYKGRLLTSDRYWPTQKWEHPWSVPGYARSAAILAGMIIGGLGIAAVIGEISAYAPALYGLLGAGLAKALRLPPTP
ncbi:MAG: hypothetical protein NTX64_18555, partial [Elusimicrobia bacterium]|nr:hypothetical protein [Elusimicrobiota bacterium]